MVVTALLGVTGTEYDFYLNIYRLSMYSYRPVGSAKIDREREKRRGRKEREKKEKEKEKRKLKKGEDRGKDVLWQEPLGTVKKL